MSLMTPNISDYTGTGLPKVSMTSKDVIELLKYWEGQNLSFMFNDLISTYQPENDRREKLWNEYGGDVPIKHRARAVEQKSNKQISVPLRNHIIDQATGYFLGNPITYDIAEHDYSVSDAEKAGDVLKDFLKRNKIEKKDIQLAEYISVCGTAYRLCYIDTNGDERIMNLKPWECVVIYDATLEEPQYAMVYYPMLVMVGTVSRVLLRLEWYDKENVTYYMQNANGYFDLDPDYPVNPQPHMFTGHIPVIQFFNNTISKGDFEPVTDLIDEYDETISDISNEVRDSAISTIIFKNCNITSGSLDMMKSTGAISLTDGTGKDADAKYLQKIISTDLLENHKKTLVDDIIIYSNSVNMHDDKFSGGTQSGESRKWKLLTLENKIKFKEVLFKESLALQFDVITSAWRTKGINIDADDITYTFTRNLPVELSLAAETNAKLVGTISDKTRLSLLPFIKDVDEELEQIELEKQASYKIDLDKIITEEANSQNVITNVDNHSDNGKTNIDLQDSAGTTVKTANNYQ